MRIIKYLFLLLLLTLVALTIYIATQKGNFTAQNSKLIHSQKSTVFGYVNDYKNWAKFSPWLLSDPNMSLTYSPNSSGLGSSLSWDGANDSGTINTLYTKANDSLVQKMKFNGMATEVYWQFKDSLGKTKVSWKAVGSLDFMSKVNAFFFGKPQNTLSLAFDKCLSNLDRSLNLENNIYEVKTNGIVKKLETFYLRQSFTSKITDINRNANVVFYKLSTFCNQNNIALNGRPFIIYHTYDSIKDLTKVSFCLPIKEQIFTSQGSDISSGKLEAFAAVKSSLIGNYSYQKEALKKLLSYASEHKIQRGLKFSYLEVWAVGKNETPNPSKWQTALYLPIASKNESKPKWKNMATDSTASYKRPQPEAVTSQEGAYKAPTIKLPQTRPASPKPATPKPATTKEALEKEPANKKSQDDFEF